MQNRATLTSLYRLGTLYNATLGSFHKSLVMEWIRDTYPEVFAALMRLAGREPEDIPRDEGMRPPAGTMMGRAGGGQEKTAKDEGKRPPAPPAFQQYGDWKIEIDRGLKP